MRKVLGASVENITVMMSKSFLLWVLLANVIASPIAYIVMRLWEQNYTYRAGFSLDIFLYTAVITIFTTLLTILLPILKSAFTNPVEVLRHE
ncbi:FtsX-like permease family protein [candidate division KSB1 bacterium]